MVTGFTPSSTSRFGDWANLSGIGTGWLAIGQSLVSWQCSLGWARDEKMVERPDSEQSGICDDVC